MLGIELSRLGPALQKNSKKDNIFMRIHSTSQDLSRNLDINMANDLLHIRAMVLLTFHSKLVEGGLAFEHRCHFPKKRRLEKWRTDLSIHRRAKERAKYWLDTAHN
jgi:hypothetical protein